MKLGFKNWNRPRTPVKWGVGSIIMAGMGKDRPNGLKRKRGALCER